MANMYSGGFKNYTKAEEMYRLALDGYEKSLGKDHEDTQRCAFNLNIFLEDMGRLDENTALEEQYPEIGL